MRARIWRSPRDARWLVRWASHCARLLRRLMADPSVPEQDVRDVWRQVRSVERRVKRYLISDHREGEP